MLGLFIAEIFKMMETRRKREMAKRVLTRSVLRMTRDCPSSRAIIFRHGAPPGARRRVLFLSSPRRRSPAATAPSSSRRHRDAHDRRRRRRRAPPSTRVRQSPPRRVVRAMRVTPLTQGVARSRVPAAAAVDPRNPWQVRGGARYVRCVVRCTERCQARERGPHAPRREKSSRCVSSPTRPPGTIDGKTRGRKFEAFPPACLLPRLPCSGKRERGRRRRLRASRVPRRGERGIDSCGNSSATNARDAGHDRARRPSSDWITSENWPIAAAPLENGTTAIGRSYKWRAKLLFNSIKGYCGRSYAESYKLIIISWSVITRCLRISCIVEKRCRAVTLNQYRDMIQIEDYIQVVY